MVSRLTFSAVARKIGVIGSMLGLLWGCEGPAAPKAEERPTGPIVAMRVTASWTPGMPSYLGGLPPSVTIDERGSTSGVLAIAPDAFEPTDPTAISVQLLNQTGAILDFPAGSEWRVTPSDTTRAVYWRFDVFKGAIDRRGLGPTSLTVALVRRSDGAALFGPFTLPIEITNTPANLAAVARLTISGLPQTPVVGARYPLTATAYALDGSVLRDRPIQWSIGDPLLATIVSQSGELRDSAVIQISSSGSLAVAASAEGRTKAERLVIEPYGVGVGALAIESVSVIESGGAYAPQLKLRETSGTGAAEFVGIQLDLPGLGPSQLCTTDRVIGPGQTMDVFWDTYGGTELAFSWNKWATGPQATVSVFLLEGGRSRRIDVVAPIVQSGPPAPWDAHPWSPWSCSRGF